MILDRSSKIQSVTEQRDQFDLIPVEKVDANVGSFIPHLPTFHLLGFCWDGHARPQNRWDGSQLSPSKT